MNNYIKKTLGGFLLGGLIGAGGLWWAIVSRLPNNSIENNNISNDAVNHGYFAVFGFVIWIIHCL